MAKVMFFPRYNNTGFCAKDSFYKCMIIGQFEKTGPLFDKDLLQKTPFLRRQCLDHHTTLIILHHTTIYHQFVQLRVSVGTPLARR